MMPSFVMLPDSPFMGWSCFEHCEVRKSKKAKNYENRISKSLNDWFTGTRSCTNI